MESKQPLCAAPFSRVFSTGFAFRNCCATQPVISSTGSDTVETWWNSSEMNEFRNMMYKDQLPADCHSCIVQENTSGRSFRTELNKIPIINSVPNSWHVVFGSVCNLACWTCNENFSSTIEHHKRRLGLLPNKFQDVNALFDRRWPNLKDHILESYCHHDTITVTVLGGEPVYNKTVIDFLQQLVESNLSVRTCLEITTNGTKINSKLMKILDKKNWKHISVFVSVDSVGKKAEWLRYGSSWKDVETSIDFYQSNAHYVELHTVVSILNVMDLPEVSDYARKKNIVHNISPVLNPPWLSLKQWNGETDFINRDDFLTRNLQEFSDAIGVTPVAGTKETVQNYIQQFTDRLPLNDFDPKLAQLLSH